MGPALEADLEPAPEASSSAAADEPGIRPPSTATPPAETPASQPANQPDLFYMWSDAAIDGLALRQI